jgi:DNA-binding beta-propeller fold protein YncE
MLLSAFSLALALAPTFATPATKPHQDGPYKVVKIAKVGGDGGFDYVYADSDGRKLYVPRGGSNSRLSIYDLDSLSLVSEIPIQAGHGTAVDSESHMGLTSSNPVMMFDASTSKQTKTIKVDGDPDGILNDPFNHRTYILSHSSPNMTVIDAAKGEVLGTIDLGGAPEQAATDGKGTIYVDLEDKDSVAVVDAATMKVKTTYGLNGKGGRNTGLALDAANGVLFVACRQPQAMVVLDAKDGHFIADFPVGRGCDGAVFNPDTNEVFSSYGDGTLTVIKENSPTSFAIEQTLKTLPGAKTLTLDRKTGQVYLITAEYGPAENGARRGPLVPGSFSIIVVGK